MDHGCAHTQVEKITRSKETKIQIEGGIRTATNAHTLQVISLSIVKEQRDKRQGDVCQQSNAFLIKKYDYRLRFAIQNP
jgi:hypothetical protein